MPSPLTTTVLSVALVLAGMVTMAGPQLKGDCTAGVRRCSDRWRPAAMYFAAVPVPMTASARAVAGRSRASKVTARKMAAAQAGPV